MMMWQVFFKKWSYLFLIGGPHHTMYFPFIKPVAIFHLNNICIFFFIDKMWIVIIASWGSCDLNV